MARDRKTGSLVGLTPVEQHHTAAHACDRGRQRHFFIEVENARRIDQRGDKQGRWSASALVAQRTRRERARSPASATAVRPRCLLVRAKSRERSARQLGIALRHFPYQFEKERQRARCAFMLQRTMLR